jgi:hypothetical protein
MNLSPLTAAAAAAGIVAAMAVLAFSQLPGLFVWASFIGWASYDQSGANLRGSLRSSAGLVFGVMTAWCVAIVVATGILPLGSTLATAVCAAIASVAIVLASAAPVLSTVPAPFYGFAATFAVVSLAPRASTMGALTSPGGQSVLLALPVSLLIGTALGVAHGWLAKLLAGTRHSTSPHLDYRDKVGPRSA